MRRILCFDTMIMKLTTKVAVIMIYIMTKELKWIDRYV